MRKVVAAFALLAMGQALAAATPSGWQRVTSENGKLSIATPCGVADVRRVQEEAGYALLCRSDGLTFMASVGLRSPLGNTVYSYDELLDRARKGLDEKVFQEATLQGRRAFGVSCSDLATQTPCVWFVDLKSGPPLMLGVFGVGGPGSGDPAKRDEFTMLAEAFYQTLELTAS